MALDRYPDLDPDDGEVVTEELFFSEDALVKAFALGPGSEVAPHEHADQTNAFHVLRGELVVVQGDDEEQVVAPGVVVPRTRRPARRPQRDRRRSGVHGDDGTDGVVRAEDAPRVTARARAGAPGAPPPGRRRPLRTD